MNIENSTLRQKLADLGDNLNFDDIAELVKDITIIERRNPLEDHRERYWCETYAKALSIAWDYGTGWNKETAPSGFIEIQDIKEEDLVVYFDEDEPTHYGRVTADHLIRSKWGAGHIFKHPIHLVPSNYGNTVKFYRSES